MRIKIEFDVISSFEDEIEVTEEELEILNKSYALSYTSPKDTKALQIIEKNFDIQSEGWIDCVSDIYIEELEEED